MIFPDEALIVGAGHIEIYIVVPRDIPLMTYGTKQTAAGQIVRDSVAYTIFMNLIEDGLL